MAYSTPKEAYGQLIPAFQKTGAGNGVTFAQSYGASGEQSRAVAAGLDADVVAFSLEPDITSLVQKRLVAKSWNKDKFHGMVTRSVVVFVVRDGNPKKLKTWNDLLEARRAGDHAEPVHLGRRALERHGRVRRRAALGQDAEAGRSTTSGRCGSTSSRSRRARARALQTFLAGRGDVFLAYENEAIFAQKKGQPVQFVIPKATILIENPIAVTTTSKHKTEAKRVRELPAHDAGAEDLRAERLPAGRAERVRKGLQLPDAAAAVHDQVRRRLGEGREEVLRSDTRA